MNQEPSNNTVARIFGWLRGFITPKDAGQRTASSDAPTAGSGSYAGDTSHQAARERAGAGDISGTPGGTSAAPAHQAMDTSERQVLPDLDDSETDYRYTGEPGSGKQPPAQAGTGGPASEAAEQIESYRSDLEDASGDLEAEGASYPSSTDDVGVLHDAVGGRDVDADAETDGIIDTNRDPDISSHPSEAPRPDNVPETDHDEPGVSEQDELTAFEGARTDEFAAGGYAPEPVDQEDVEAAAEGAPTSVPDKESPDSVDNQHRMGGSGETDTAGADVPEVREYNYGLGDLGAGTTSGGSAESETIGGPSETAQASGTSESPSQETSRPGSDDSGKRGISREEIESTAAGDAFVQGDEAVTAPGQSGPAAFTRAETGTVEPSRSATGNDVDDEEQDALGTTLEYDETEADPFDTDEANLSGQEELSVLDDDRGDRDASFEGGAPGQATTEMAEGPSTDQETRDSYADFPDEPAPEHTDESGLDDFAGSDYPSDHRVDRLAGDDAFDAEEPDPINDAGSSAGDLDTEDSTEELLITQLDDQQGTGGDVGVADRTIDQDNVGTSDEHVGGEEPAFVDNLQKSDVPGNIEDAGASAGTAVSGAARDAGTTDEGGDAPAGAVRGDGTTDTPAGYPIKGNASSKIYHLPEYPSYKGTKAEFCFATEEDAIAAGYRAPGKRNRGRGKKR